MALTTPIGKGAAKSARNNQPVKRDINLISNKEAQDRIARAGGFILLAILLSGILAYVAFVMPLSAQADLDRSAADAKNQAAAMQANADQFEKLITQRDSLNALKQYMADIGSSESDSSALLDMLESACPQPVTLRNLMLNINYLTLSGFAKSDSDVAQLLVNLQDSGKFAEVRVDSVMAAADDMGVPLADGQTRAFTLTAVFPHALITASPAAASAATATAAPAATPAATTQGGDAK